MKPRFLNIYGLTPVPRPNVPDVVHPRDVGGEPPAVLRLRVPIDRTPEVAEAGRSQRRRTGCPAPAGRQDNRSVLFGSRL